MAINLTINGSTFQYPEQGDELWGANATDWAVAVTNGMLQKAGGLFQLLGEVDFGSAYGITSIHFQSRTPNSASVGSLRLARTDVINWRNQANSADISLSVNSSNQLLFNGAALGNFVSVSDTSTIDLTLTGTDLTADIIADSVDNSLLAPMATLTIKGNNTGGSSNPLDLNVTQVTAMLNPMVGDSGSGGTKGLVPAPATGDFFKFLKGDGTWASVSGSGDVVGPASATDNAVVRFNLTSGKLIQNSLATLDDFGTFYTPASGTFGTGVNTTVIGMLSSAPVIDITNFILKDNNGYAAVNWNLDTLADSNNVASADWLNRVLKDSTGTTNLDWSGSGISITGFLNLDSEDADTVPYLDSSKNLVSSTVTPTQLGYLDSFIPVDTGGTGQTSYTDGQILIGNSSGNTLTKTTLTAGNGISVTNGAGSITVTNTGTPPGVIIAYGGTSAPTGYLLCDGTSYLRTDYANLYTAIGNAYGTADGTHFNVPDLRGQFLRGVTGASGNDPDASSRTAMKTGGNTGNNVGSIQADELRSHTHPYNGTPQAAQNFPGGGMSSGSNSTTSATGGNETRPINAYVNFIIKT
jgi:microcystin-dependent protein